MYDMLVLTKAKKNCRNTNIDKPVVHTMTIINVILVKYIVYTSSRTPDLLDFRFNYQRPQALKLHLKTLSIQEKGSTPSPGKGLHKICFWFANVNR